MKDKWGIIKKNSLSLICRSINIWNWIEYEVIGLSKGLEVTLSNSGCWMTKMNTNPIYKNLFDGLSDVTVVLQNDKFKNKFSKMHQNNLFEFYVF